MLILINLTNMDVFLLIFNDKSHINSIMIQNNHGYPYDGGTKKNFDDIEN